jgi:hypothetical protein
MTFKLTEAQRSAMKRVAKAMTIIDDFDSAESRVLKTASDRLYAQLAERYAFEENEEAMHAEGELMMAEIEQEAAVELRAAIEDVRIAFRMQEEKS